MLIGVIALTQHALAGGNVPLEANESHVNVLTQVPGGALVVKMAFTFVSLGLTFILLMTCCCLCRMDPDKSQDTMLYAKFIANTDKKHAA